VCCCDSPSLPGSSSPISERVAGLYDESFDHTVEDKTIVISVLTVDSEVFHCFGYPLSQRRTCLDKRQETRNKTGEDRGERTTNVQVGEEFNVNIAKGSMNDCRTR